jgi:hypothetical protein
MAMLAANRVNGYSNPCGLKNPFFKWTRRIATIMSMASNHAAHRVNRPHGGDGRSGHSQNAKESSHSVKTHDEQLLAAVHQKYGAYDDPQNCEAPWL